MFLVGRFGNMMKNVWMQNNIKPIWDQHERLLRQPSVPANVLRLLASKSWQLRDAKLGEGETWWRGHVLGPIGGGFKHTIWFMYHIVVSYQFIILFFLAWRSMWWTWCMFSTIFELVGIDLELFRNVRRCIHHYQALATSRRRSFKYVRMNVCLFACLFVSSFVCLFVWLVSSNHDEMIVHGFYMVLWRPQFVFLFEMRFCLRNRSFDWVDVNVVGSGRWLSTFWDATVFTARTVGSLSFYLGVSKNSGTPKWMIYKGKPY